MDADYLAKFKKNPTSVLNGAITPPPRPRSERPDGLTGRGLGGGRGMKARYNSPDAMAFVIDEYFVRCEAMEQPPTIADLVLALGFSTKRSLQNYKEKDDEFRHVIETAETRMEGWKNRQLLKGGPTTQGTIFDLKNNHGWADKSESTVTHTPGGSLAELVQALQGKVLRPSLVQPEEEIVEGEFSEEPAEEPASEEVVVEEVEEYPKKKKKFAAGEEWMQEVQDMLYREYEEDKRIEGLNLEDML